MSVDHQQQQHDNAAAVSDRVALVRFPHLQLVLETPKGRGVFAACNIPSGTTLDVSPVLPLPPDEDLSHTTLNHYTYNWPVIRENGVKGTTTQAVVFGLGSMFNHSVPDQNVGWRRDLDKQVIVYWTLKDVLEGEELCISYGDHLTFVDVERRSVEAVEREEDVLNRIELGSESEEQRP